jgi:SAM-dependent methyltransferase
MSSSSAENPYKRLNYRRLIAWPARIERESPFLEEEVRRAPKQSVIDLGCGTGEHARHLAAAGFRAVGIDRSEEQIAKARDFEEESSPRGPVFLCGDIETLPDLTEELFGTAICLGNVLPHLDDESLGRALDAVATRLVSGGRLLLQIINYERVMIRGDRHLPLNFRPDPEGSGEVVFLRLMKREGENHVRFFPSTLLLRPGDEPPLRVEASKEVLLRAWRLPDLERLLSERLFRVDGTYGDMKKSTFEAEESSDLILTAVFEGRDAQR